MKKKEDINKKNIIFYSREYRKMSIKRKNGIVFILLGMLPVILLILFFYSQITHAMSAWAQQIVASLLSTDVWMDFSSYIPFFGDVYFAVTEVGFPTFSYSLICVICCLLSVVILPQIKSGWRPLMLYLTIGAWVLLASALFFLFIPEYFPYTMKEYSELYVKQQVSIWLMIAFSSGVAVALLYSSFLSKLICFFCIMACAFVFGTIRYVIFILLLKMGSLIFMAPLFFILGVLFDFLQMIAIYSVFVKYLSEKMDSSKEKGGWEWL